MRRTHSALALFLLVGIAISPARANAGSDGRVEASLARLAATDPEHRVAVWVYFTDRAGAERNRAAFEEVARRLPARALERRARRGSVVGLEASDLPVHAPYVGALVSRGARLRGTSRWLNAASVEIPAREALAIASLPFVARVERVQRGYPISRFETVEERIVGGPRAPDAGESSAGPPEAAAAPGDPAFYGGAYRQLGMMQVPALHAQGLSGAGVLVCVLDTGFRLTHRAYAGLQLLAARDFIHGDTIVDNEAGQDIPSQRQHGTLTLACIAGHQPDVFSGGAFGVTVALGKTEDVTSETPVEMDYWQFGAEWADSLGADVISSSLGYSTFDNPADSYTYGDMDGRTTVVTRAAAEAARRGITVVTAAGNAGQSPWHYIIAPGDADTVITSGAVDSFNVVTGFSSRGPTSDGRIKPDVTAMGRSVLTVDAENDSNLVRVSGTSFSTPLTASVVALLLEANPTWRPFEVREALRETALNHAAPNNDIGWGLIQAVAAVSWVPSTVGVPGQRPQDGLALGLGPNPLRRGTEAVIRFAGAGTERTVLEVWDLAGRRQARLFDGPAPSERSLTWRGEASDGRRLPAGVYWVRLLSPAGSGARSQQRVVRVVLLP
jgi:Subtilase family